MPALERTGEARLLIERALQLLPKAADAAEAREVLAALPDEEPSAAPTEDIKAEGESEAGLP